MRGMPWAYLFFIVIAVIQAFVAPSIALLASRLAEELTTMSSVHTIIKRPAKATGLLERQM